jgi:OmpA-OmpF porin, OOP family
MLCLLFALRSLPAQESVPTTATPGPALIVEDDKAHSIDATNQLNEQCAALFHAAMRGRKIEFALSSSKLSTSASPLLDELIQIAADCPAAAITITGHTDDSGNEISNLALSTNRASAVAEYITARGINSARVAVNGAGSSSPLSIENTVRARRRNRRIDIQIGFAEN